MTVQISEVRQTTNGPGFTIQTDNGGAVSISFKSWDDAEDARNHIDEAVAKAVSIHVHEGGGTATRTR